MADFDIPISIIIPVYNTEQYIQRCLDCIISQTMPYFECIIVNDCSSDTSSLICDDYAQRDNRIKVIHNQEPRSKLLGMFHQER